ncbi:S1C family serine protease [Nocardioides euryhalodurans]|uniref:PDZ domain-containing protein n=1 Tax=Nocardioides euryhalodurans TaxID=2518370 RepID=A0A4P7GNE6_9ACTN|nr:trypsin-like peptidase domain-containing protein [Nocardioides euryhalodurans]QBR93715.1 PDZ domain-containing protein [Nocardioides euryhalodurans]
MSDHHEGQHRADPSDAGEPTQPIVRTPSAGASWLPPVHQAPPGHWQAPPTQPLATPQGGSRVAGWVWPAVAGLALVIGLLGGIGGAVLVDDLDSLGPGTVSDGLQGVQTREDAPLAGGNRSLVAVADQLLPSTVQILAEYDGAEGGATGSGFVLDRQGHIITNNHVVQQADENDGLIQVVDDKGNRYDVEVVGRSAVYDLAVLYARDARGLPPAALGASRRLAVGESVVAFGSPLGLSSTVTSGIVSALNRPVTTGDSANDSSYINAVQTDAAINPGNSGGPLVNLQGQVVGVNSAIATTGSALGGRSGNIGVGFAIPIEQVRVTADQILRTGEARYPVIGAQVQTGGESNVNGARIDQVLADTPAEASGLQEGDVVTEVNGQRVTDGISLIVAIRSYQPGETIDFTLTRDGDEQVVSVTLGAETG